MTQFSQTKLVLKRGDITKETVDAIVNAANSSLMGGGGVDGAIHRAGGPAILQECMKVRERQGSCSTGKAIVTTAGKLKAKHVIHTIGPIWRGGDQGEAEVLRQCYINSLAAAVAIGDKTIAFPAISTGAYGYPIDEAAQVAVQAVQDFAAHDQTLEEVRFVLFAEYHLAVFQEAVRNREKA